MKIKYLCPYCNSNKIAIKSVGDLKQYKVAFCIHCEKTPVKNSNASYTSIGAIREWNKSCKKMEQNK